MSSDIMKKISLFIINIYYTTYGQIWQSFIVYLIVIAWLACCLFGWKPLLAGFQLLLTGWQLLLASCQPLQLFCNCTSFLLFDQPLNIWVVCSHIQWISNLFYWTAATDFCQQPILSGKQTIWLANFPRSQFWLADWSFGSFTQPKVAAKF